MFNQLPQEKTFCGLDIGANSIKVALVHAHSVQNFELIGAYETKTFGFKDGTVTDLPELTECIHKALKDLSQKTSVKIKEVVLGVPGDILEARLSECTIPLIERGSKIIAERDIEKVNSQAKLLGINLEEEVIHNFPQDYQLDDKSAIINPVGLYGRKLGIHTLVVAANINRIRNITKAVSQAGFDIYDTVFSSYAASKVCFQEEELKRGCALIDLGASNTSVLIFKDGLLKYFDKIFLGANDLTKQISYALQIPLELAEDIKKSYGFISGNEEHLDEEILVKRENVYLPIKRRLIHEALKPVAGDIIARVNNLIRNNRSIELLGAGMVTIGGGALLPGLLEGLSDSNHFEIRLGKINLDLQKRLGNSTIFASSIGLAMMGVQKAQSKVKITQVQGNWTQQIAHRVKELYYEYF